VADGLRTREIVHAWAVPWVEGDADVGPPQDIMVGTGLQYLHGLDMTGDPSSLELISHGGPGGYVLSDNEVSARLEHWLEMRVEYNADPQGFVERARERAPYTLPS
jgi:hypothetical protein